LNVELMIPGIAEPKGSFTAVRRGRFNILLNGGNSAAHERHKDWAHRVAHYAKATVAANAILSPCDEPMCFDVTFYLPRPKSAAKRTHCAVKPDIDKLLRAVFDPLKDILITEDSRFVGGSVKKVYADEANPPGCWVRIWSV
jgi:Holliday junction resolvase RusA-like endonuclease